MTLLPILCAFLLAIPAGMGVGGGGLFVLYLIFVCGMGQIEAQGVNLVFFLFSALAATLCNLKGKKLSFKDVLPQLLAGLPAVLLGVWVSRAIDTLWLRRIFAIFLMISGVVSAVYSHKKQNIQ